MDRLMDGITYIVRDNNGQQVCVGKWPNSKVGTIALYVEKNARATPLAYFRDEESAVKFLNAMGGVK